MFPMFISSNVIILSFSLKKKLHFFCLFDQKKRNNIFLRLDLWYRIISFKCNDSSRVSHSNHIHERKKSKLEHTTIGTLKFLSSYVTCFEFSILILIICEFFFFRFKTNAKNLMLWTTLYHFLVFRLQCNWHCVLFNFF